MTDLDSANTLDLSTVRAEANGTVEIYDFRAGEQRELLGSTEVFAGANSDVRVEVQVATMFEVLAVFKVSDQVVDMQMIDINSWSPAALPNGKGPPDGRAFFLFA